MVTRGVDPFGGVEHAGDDRGDLRLALRLQRQEPIQIRVQEEPPQRL
jgi:hypothetical protein